MNDGEYVAEFGSSCGGFRFLNYSQVKMYDSEGEVMLCKCGKPATEGIIGKEAYIARCSECMREGFISS